MVVEACPDETEVLPVSVVNVPAAGVVAPIAVASIVPAFIAAVSATKAVGCICLFISISLLVASQSRLASPLPPSITKPEPSAGSVPVWSLSTVNVSLVVLATSVEPDKDAYRVPSTSKFPFTYKSELVDALLKVPVPI